MDYPIQPISVIEEQGSAAALAGQCPVATNPYADGTGHCRAWKNGYVCEVIEQAESPVLLMITDGRVEFVNGVRP